MPISRAACEIEPVRPIASSSSILPMPMEHRGEKSTRKRILISLTRFMADPAGCRRRLTPISLLQSRVPRKIAVRALAGRCRALDERQVRGIFHPVEDELPAVGGNIEIVDDEI